MKIGGEVKFVTDWHTRQKYILSTKAENPAK